MRRKLNSAIIERLQKYRNGLSTEERHYVSSFDPSTARLYAESNPARPPFRLAIEGMLLKVPPLQRALETLPDSEIVPDAYGQALELSAFLLRNGLVTRWPAFAIAMHRTVGDAIVPWLASLYLSAVTLPTLRLSCEDAEEALDFKSLACGD